MDVDKRVRLSPGYILSFALVTIALLMWIPGFDFETTSTSTIVFITLAKMAAFGGTIMFAWSLILSGRFKIFDRLFRGLDKVYGAHRLFATLGLFLLIIHPVALIIASLPTRGASAWSLLWKFDHLPFALGLIALYGSIGIICWSAWSKASHETFVKVHRVLGLLFILGAVHAFLAGSVLANNAFMYWYLLGVCGAASLVFVHYSILSDVLHRFYRYTVVDKQELPGDVLRIKLRPKYRIMNFLPGQFVYASFRKSSDHSYHPFSIASGKRSTDMELYVKELGDFTSELAVIKKGDPVRVKGPYGGFTFNDKRFDKQIWIAGGIGITPFLSKARSLEHARQWPEIELIYATQSKHEGFAVKELTKLQHQHGCFNFTLVHANKFGQKSLHDLAEHFRGDLKDCAIYLCGPPPMLAAYQKQAEEMGLQDQLYFEEFSY